MKNLTIQFKITALLIASLVLTAVVSTVVVIVLMKNDATVRLANTKALMTQEKVTALSEKVEMATLIIRSFYEASQKEIASGKSQEEATKENQEKAKAGDQYAKEHVKDYWWQMIQLLPSSYNQRRTVMLNYEVLANIYKSRRNHKLDEWHTYCDWALELPYFKTLIADTKD